MDCKTLNEKTYADIENFLEVTKKENQNTQGQSYFKSLYSPATLINDWLEKRTEEYPAVASDLGPPLTENMDKFRKLCATSFPDRREYFNKLFESDGYGQELLFDHLGFSYYGNYVSSYDLCYNHLTKGICGPYPRRYYRDGYKPNTDLSLIYGNLTQWGLKEKLYEKIKEENTMEPTPVSETRAEYVNFNWSEVKKLNDFPSFKRVKVTY